MKRVISFAVMLAPTLFGCMTATEQQQLDSDRYNQLHTAALSHATQVKRGKMSKEDATLQLAQTQFETSADQRNGVAVQGAAPQALVVAAMARDQSSQSACTPVGHILFLNLSTTSTREDHDCENE
jgi:hypothetical protein